MTYIEKGRSGPSKLDEQLEALRDFETGHVILTKNEAIHILIESLLGFYQSQVSSPSPEIEALAQIAGTELPGVYRFDFTETIEKRWDEMESIKEEQNQRDIERREREGFISTSPEPPQAEI